MNRASFRFDPQELADEMVKFFHTMHEVKKEITEFKRNVAGIERNQSSAIVKALKTLASMIATRNYYRKVTKGFKKEIDIWQRNHNSNPLTDTAKNELIIILDQHGMNWPGWSSSDRIRKLLEQLQDKTVKEWTEGLYKKVLIGSKNDEGEVIGIGKGADNFLRDYGYFDRVPIDIHEKRFILRTGIFNYCSSMDSDPLEPKDLQEALVVFCGKYLSGSEIENIDLGKAPGVVDIFIWNFCAKNRYNICGATPKCHECPLSAVCLFTRAGERPDRLVGAPTIPIHTSSIDLLSHFIVGTVRETLKIRKGKKNPEMQWDIEGIIAIIVTITFCITCLIQAVLARKVPEPLVRFIDVLLAFLYGRGSMRNSVKMRAASTGD